MSWYRGEGEYVVPVGRAVLHCEPTAYARLRQQRRHERRAARTLRTQGIKGRYFDWKDTAKMGHFYG